MKKALETVNEKILASVQRRQPNLLCSKQLPRLVAVSKLQPIASIIEAYEYGQRYFGENYIQELEDKSNSPEILENCPDIKFHFIGRLQSNKVNRLFKVKNLHMLETIDSMKLADLANKAIERHNSDDRDAYDKNNEKFTMLNERLKIMIQVNTSGEESKSGVEPEEAPQLAEHILAHCPWLELAGIMTIGKIGGWPGEPVNKDFVRLYELRDIISKRISVEPQSLELSMGMSSDFEEAVSLGSSNVRVGTLIFGERKPK